MNLGDYKPLEIEVVQGMSAIANLNINTKFMMVGCGEGQFLETALALGVKPANVSGVELDPALAAICQGKGLNVVNDDCFNLDYSGYDCVMFWFNMSDGLTQFMQKLYNELGNNKKVVCLHGTRQQWRDGVWVPEESCYDVNTGVGILPFPTWVPSAQGEVLGNRFYVYTR